MAKIKKEKKLPKKHNQKSNKKLTLKKRKRQEHQEKALKFAAKSSNLETNAVSKIKGAKLPPATAVKTNNAKHVKPANVEKKKNLRLFNHDNMPNKKLSSVVQNEDRAQVSKRSKRKKKRKNKNGIESNVSSIKVIVEKKTDKVQKTMTTQGKPQLNSLNNTLSVNSTDKKKKQKHDKQDTIEKLELIKEKRTRQQERGQRKPIEAKEQEQTVNSKAGKQSKLNLKRLEKILFAQTENTKKKNENTKTQPLRDRMMAKLKASRFRFLNEGFYSSRSTDSRNYFTNDPDAFTAYHEGYSQQVKQWPLNPLDNIITSIKKLPKDFVIADFGCGEAKLATSVPQKVHSFDFISLNDKVTACDMAHTPLLTNGGNVVVFCLSLMGTNLNDYLIEANRVLKKDGILKIAEVESRFNQVDDFIKSLKDYGFKLTWKDLSHNLFYFLDFKKEKDIASGRRNKLPAIALKPCLYKKR